MVRKNIAISNRCIGDIWVIINSIEIVSGAIQERLIGVVASIVDVFIIFNRFFGNFWARFRIFFKIFQITQQISLQKNPIL